MGPDQTGRHSEKVARCEQAECAWLARHHPVAARNRADLALVFGECGIGFQPMKCGEHARLDCERNRLNFVALKQRFGETPKPTPETDVLPNPRTSVRAGCQFRFRGRCSIAPR